MELKLNEIKDKVDGLRHFVQNKKIYFEEDNNLEEHNELKYCLRFSHKYLEELIEDIDARIEKASKGVI